MPAETEESRIATLEKQVAQLQKQIADIHRNLANMPSRMQVDSIMQQQQSGSIFDIF